MTYHLLIAVAGIAILLAGWLAVQSLAAAGRTPEPAAAPATAEACGCGACTQACPAAPALPAHARDGPAAPPPASNPSGLRPSCC